MRARPAQRAEAPIPLRVGYKALLYALLAANTVYFAVAGMPSKAVDAAAWLALLLLFEAETGLSHRMRSERARSALRAARLIAGAGVIAATAAYVFEENVLDAANSVLWIAVVVLLELEVRWPDLVARGRAAFAVCATVLYGALAVPVALWALRGEWVDAYDALIWLIAFATIELDVMRRAGKAPAAV